MRCSRLFPCLYVLVHTFVYTFSHVRIYSCVCAWARARAALLRAANLPITRWPENETFAAVRDWLRNGPASIAPGLLRALFGLLGGNLDQRLIGSIDKPPTISTKRPPGE